jgi:hypothetical protein
MNPTNRSNYFVSSRFWEHSLRFVLEPLRRVIFKYWEMPMYVSELGTYYIPVPDGIDFLANFELGAYLGGKVSLVDGKL